VDSVLPLIHALPDRIVVVLPVLETLQMIHKLAHRAHLGLLIIVVLGLIEPVPIAEELQIMILKLANRATTELPTIVAQETIEPELRVPA